MIDISFEINGKKVHPNQMKGALEQAMYQQVAESMKEKLKSIRDPETGEKPKIVMKGKSFDDLTLEVFGSEDVIEQVKKRLA